MSDGTKAVFISYAREDVEAARRIAEALRSFGVEVWLDQNELRGGDAWDTKLRTQIRTCTLFMPIITASTQARTEGYFRREWKLAVERTHDMAAGAPFLVPVVIDETTESEAIVPEEFVRVQWTRLPDGLPTPQFIAQVKHLLDQAAAARMASRPGTRSGLTVPPAKQRRPLWPWVALGAVVVGGAVVFFAPRQPAPSTAAPALTAAANDKSIAVLPFTNASDDKDTNAFFADGIHEDILTNLSGIREMRVVSRTSVMEYRGTTKKMRQIGGELGVTYILEGSVRRVGNKVRVTGQLINARTDEHVWAKNYDRDLSDIFAIQAELAQEIAGALHAVLSPGEKTLLERRPTNNLAAYDLFLKARALAGYGLLQEFDIRVRRELLEQSVQLDPDFVEAWVELGEIHSANYFTHRDRSAATLAKAREAIGHATRLAPDDPVVLIAEGVYYLNCFRDYARARTKLESVQQQWPNNAMVHFQLGNIASREGRWEDALRHSRRACELDRRSVLLLEGLHSLLHHLRRYDEALDVARQILVIRPDNLSAGYRVAQTVFWSKGDPAVVEEWFANVPVARRTEREFRFARASWSWDCGDATGFLQWNRELGDSTGAGQWFSNSTDLFGLALKLAGEPAQARIWAEEMSKTVDTGIDQQPDNRIAWGRRAMLLRTLGQTAQAVAAADRAVELMPESLDAKYGSDHAIVRVWALAAAGRKEDALQETARLLGKPSLLNVHTMRRSLEWKELQGDPRFEALLNDPKNNAPLP
jgi:TolB-like protein